MEYDEEDYLQLSGLQHFRFCRRRWALIHIENLWADNLRTVDGELMHKNAHDEGFRESRKDLLVTRGMRVFSCTMGVSGQCDILEFHRGLSGVPMPEREGLWQPYPVEYKRGAPNAASGDALQLCGQAMCLEEMLCCPIPEGALYFGETRRRQTVAFTQELRQDVHNCLSEMHGYVRRGYTPKVKPTKSCNACSLKELCLPRLMTVRPVSEYLRANMENTT